jgi:hypothetical protein
MLLPLSLFLNEMSSQTGAKVGIGGQKQESLLRESFCAK